MPIAPLVSVIIPSYNHEDYVVGAIRSVLEQSYRPIELIVVDDGSKDESWARITAYRDETGGAFEAYRKPNGGVSSALNFGIARSTGAFIAVLASDDYFLPGKLERQMAAFAELDASWGIVHTSAFNDHGDGKLVDITGLYPPAVGACFVDLVSLRAVAVAPSVMFRREVYDSVGGFDETLVAEDLDFYASVAARGFLFHFIPEPLLVKRHTGRNLGLNVEGNYQAHLKTLEKYRSRLSAEQYRVALYSIYLSQGRHAAATGAIGKSLAAYRSAARLTGSPAPLVEWAVRVSRQRILRTLPAGLRSVLRRERSRSAARRRRGAANAG